MTREQQARIEELTGEVEAANVENERLRSLLDSAYRDRRSELPDAPVRMDPVGAYDALGRKQPRRLNYADFARAIPGYAALFTGRVPDNFYAQVDDGVVEVACPCKPDQLPRCELLVPTPCACERWFVYTGSIVRVARLGPAADCG
jgi:hypothetical protein